MTFKQSITTCFQKYIDFSGRASRSEYWWFFLFTMIVRIVTGWIPGVGFIVALILLLPSLSATVRRLHDTNRTGWWLLLPIGLTVVTIVLGVILAFTGLIFLGVGIALVGSIAGFVALLVFLIQPGDSHPNQYGSDPLYQGAGADGFQQEPGHPYASASPAEPDQLPNFDSAPSYPSQPREPGQGRYCIHCGMQLQPDARFCTECGTAA